MVYLALIGRRLRQQRQRIMWMVRGVWFCVFENRSKRFMKAIFYILIAVAVFSLVARPDRPLAVVLVLQYRPPVNKIVVELPAGLVDGNESIETTALREWESDLQSFCVCVFRYPSLVSITDPKIGLCLWDLIWVRLYEETGYGRGEHGGVASVEDVNPFMVVSHYPRFSRIACLRRSFSFSALGMCLYVLRWSIVYWPWLLVLRLSIVRSRDEQRNYVTSQSKGGVEVRHGPPTPTWRRYAERYILNS